MQVRDGQLVVPTCDECGCRLGQFEDMWYHFYGDTKRDAKGHLCSQYHVFIEIDPKTLDKAVISIV